MIIIGIDPGLSGAIAILRDKKILGLFDVPVMSEGKKNKRQLNSAQLVKILKEFTNDKKDEEVVVVVEPIVARKVKFFSTFLTSLSVAISKILSTLAD